MFANPLGLIALAGVPIVVALHLFRRRFRPRTVSAIFLWSDEDQVSVAGRRRERVRKNASFWLELCAALFFGLLCGGPRACGGAHAQHLVVVLDASASMGATVEGRSLRDAAVELVEERVGDLSSRARVTLLESGPRPRLLAGPAAFPGAALESLADYRPAAARHDLTGTVALGLQLAGEGTVLVVTDHFEPERHPEAVELVSVGKATDNHAITHATRVRSSAGTDQVLVTVAGFARSPRRNRIVVSCEGVELDRRPLELEPGARQHFTFELAEDTPAVRVRLEPDALTIDDEAVLAPVRERVIAIACTLPLQTARVLGLSTGEASPIDRLLSVVPHSVEAPSAQTAHLVIGSERDGGSGAWVLALAGESDPSGASTGEHEDLIGPFLAEREHPLFTGLTLEGIVWSAADTRALHGTPLLSSGDRPLFTEELDPVGTGRRTYRMNLIPARSSLQRSPDWPILLANLAELRRAALPGPTRANLAIGESFRYRTETSADYVLHDEAGEPVRELSARNTLVLDDLDRAGLYTLSRRGETGVEALCRFGLSFADPAESDLRSMFPGQRAAAGELSTVLAGLNGLETLLVAVILLLALCDWWVLGRAFGPSPSRGAS